MARGGYRPGAGRKPGPQRQKELAERGVMSDDVKRAAKASGMTPLEYMLSVMRNPEADQTRRDRMAIAAAPFCHPRKEPVGQGKREERAERAQAAATGRFATPAAPKLIVDNG